MPCEKIGNTIICYNNMYRYQFKGRSFTFKFHRVLGYVPLTQKELQPMKRVSSIFWEAIEEFDALSEEEKEAHIFEP